MHERSVGRLRRAATRAGRRCAHPGRFISTWILSSPDAAIGEDVLQSLLDREHRRRELPGPAFLRLQRSDHPVLVPGGEFLQLELGHQVVDVVNDRAAEQARQHVANTRKSGMLLMWMSWYRSGCRSRCRLTIAKKVR